MIVRCIWYFFWSSRGRCHPRQAEASAQRCPSPPCTSPELQGRPGLLGVRAQTRRQSPDECVSNHFGSRIENRKTYKTLVADQLSCEPEEGLLEVVVGLGGDIVVLEVLLAVECDCLGLDFALLHIDFVTAQNNGNVLADTDKVT